MCFSDWWAHFQSNSSCCHAHLRSLSLPLSFSLSLSFPSLSHFNNLFFSAIVLKLFFSLFVSIFLYQSLSHSLFYYTSCYILFADCVSLYLHSFLISLFLLILVFLSLSLPLSLSLSLSLTPSLTISKIFDGQTIWWNRRWRRRWKIFEAKNWNEECLHWLTSKPTHSRLFLLDH